MKPGLGFTRVMGIFWTRTRNPGPAIQKCGSSRVQNFAIFADFAIFGQISAVILGMKHPNPLNLVRHSITQRKCDLHASHMHHRPLKLRLKEELSSTLFYHWTRIGPGPGFSKKVGPGFTLFRDYFVSDEGRVAWQFTRIRL